jgi:hypothetical protein
MGNCNNKEQDEENSIDLQYLLKRKRDQMQIHLDLFIEMKDKKYLNK